MIRPKKQGGELIYRASKQSPSNWSKIPILTIPYQPPRTH